MPQNVSSTTPAVVAPSSVGTFPSGAINTPPNAVIRHGGYAVPFSPVMRSKSPARSVRVGPPDFSGMRERRTESEMTVSQLQQLRGVKRTGETTPSAGWMTTVSSMGQQAWETLTGVFSFEIGPPGAAAAPVIAKVPTLGEFQAKFSTDFEIWASPSARNAVDMKGTIVVLGEDHYDRGVAVSIQRVMQGFRHGDRLFKEGGKEAGCREREARYGLRNGECRLLEKGAPIFDQMNMQLESVLLAQKACVAYLRKHVPLAASDTLPAANLKVYADFIQRYSRQLPAVALPAFIPLNRAYKASYDELDASMQKNQAGRDKAMADMLRTNRDASGVNYAIVGAAHLQRMRTHLRDSSCVFMLPKSMLANPLLDGLKESLRDEL